MRLRTQSAARTAAGVRPPASARTATNTRARFAPDELILSNDITGSYELYAVNLTDQTARRLTTTPGWDNIYPRISPDRRNIVWVRQPAGPEDVTKMRLWVADADGRNARVVIDPTVPNPSVVSALGHAEWFPNATMGSAGPHVVVLAVSVVLASKVGIYGVNLNSGQLQNIYQYSGAGGTVGLGATDPMVTADGQWIVYCDTATGSDAATATRVWRVPTDQSGIRTQLQTHATYQVYDPYVSPDMSTLAMLYDQNPPLQAPIRWGVFRVPWPNGNSPVDGGTAILNAAASPTTLITSRPSWVPRDWAVDPQGWLYTHRLDASIWPYWRIAKAKWDGTGLTYVTLPFANSNSVYPHLGFP